MNDSSSEKSSQKFADMSSPPSTQSKATVIIASVLLFLGAIVHIAYYPHLTRAIASGHITKAPGILPVELQSVWIGLSLFMLCLALTPLFFLQAAQPLRRVSLVFGLTLLTSAGVLMLFTCGVDPAVIILGAAGALFAYGGATA